MRLIPAIVCFALMTSPGVVLCDIIYFKDGMRTLCQGRAWEEKDEIKCDYDGVILSYRKEDVEHIDKTIPTGEIDEPQSSENTDTEDSVSAVAPALAPASNLPDSGPAFYDPRRPYKYWSSPSARHHTYREAVEALSREYGRSTRWIEERIGTTNNLERIRKILMGTDEPSEPVAVSIADSQPVAESAMFYSPRRKYKYQISAAQKFDTYEEAIGALALDYGTTPRWVEDHMGAHNDINVIRENLSRQKSGSDDR